MSPSRRAASRSADSCCNAARDVVKSPFAAATATAEVSPARAAGTAASRARRCVPSTPATRGYDAVGFPDSASPPPVTPTITPTAAAATANAAAIHSGRRALRGRAVDRDRASTAVGAVSRRSSRNRIPTSAALGRSAGSAAVMSVSSARQPLSTQLGIVGARCSRTTAAATPEPGNATWPVSASMQHQPERVDVAGRCDLLTGGLFGAEVVRGSQRGADHGEPGAVEQARDAEIGELGGHPPIAVGWGQQHVGRLDVAVHDARARARRRVPRRAARRCRPGRTGHRTAGDGTGQRAALDQFHDQVGERVGSGRWRRVRRRRPSPGRDGSSWPAGVPRRYGGRRRRAARRAGGTP